MARKIVILLVIIFVQFTVTLAGTEIPLPEHPRPDFQRSAWQNLNGRCSLGCDSLDAGVTAQWFTGQKDFPLKIQGPFPWGSPLSGVPDEADIAWYQREIQIPGSWQGRRVFLIFGASDWYTTAWLDGREIGQFKGGYTPFEFEVTSMMKAGRT